MSLSMKELDAAISLEEITIKALEDDEEGSASFDMVILEFLKELKKYRCTGLDPETCHNYRVFENECIRDNTTFKQILTLKDIVKGMTCDTCRNKGKCAINDNFNIRYCSDWEKGE